MDSNNKSSFGDWMFLVGSVGAVGAYFAYENAAQINAWLMAMQTPATTTNAVGMATDASMGAWMASNWGMVALMVAIIIAALKWALVSRGGAVGSDTGPAVTYKQYRFVNVKLVR